MKTATKHQPAAGPQIVDGAHQARLVHISRFTNSFGERLGFEFELIGDGHAKTTVMQSAALSSSPHGKMAGMLRGIMGREPTEAELGAGADYGRLIGADCTVLIRQEHNREGKPHPAVHQVFR